MGNSNIDLQNEKHRYSSDNTRERKLTPEEGARLMQETREARARFREYMIQRRKQEAQESQCDVCGNQETEHGTINS